MIFRLFRANPRISRAPVEITAEGSKQIRMTRFSRKRLILALLILLPLAVAGWIYTRRPKPVVIATYVPETALGYIEVNNWPTLVDNLTSTKAWRELAPSFGVPKELNYFSKIGRWNWLAWLTGGGEAAMLARSQFAVVITGLEVRGEQVKPRMALIVETRSKADSLREVAEKRLSQFAGTAFGKFSRENDEYAGVPITTWRAADPEKQMLSAQIDGELILANHIDPLRNCIDTRLGRAPSMDNNFHLRNSRPLVEPEGGESAIFGFITGEGVTRLLRFWAFIISGDTLSKAAIAGAMGDVFTDFSSRATEGIAYGASFDGAGVVDRYTLVLKPDLADSLRAAVKPARRDDPKASGRRVLELIPMEARDVTLIGVENPVKALDGIEAVIASRVGAAQSFLLHQFIIGARDIFLGIKENDKTDGVIGDEIANFNLTGESKDRVWLIAQRNEDFITTLLERVFTARGAKISREKYKDHEIIRSSEERRGAAVIVGDFLALGRRESLIHLIDTSSSGSNFNNSPQFAAANKISSPGTVDSFSSVKDESGEMLATVARWMSPEAQPEKSKALNQLPLASSSTSIKDRGVYVEAHSPFGNFPFFVSLIDGSMKGRTDN